ncbi:YncE family protein [Microbacterium testaceum]|uniref:YncE family protein n=1 Tax=Microbacterium testaceum TaxID=2033 RepID=UPI0025AEDCA5|nr:putative Ig domain-containing protein [Microbacterium testaceum]WJS91215.1 putative Ig domain-containing protein [Microbacterium testaceum]
MGGEPTSIVVSPDGGTLYVGNYDTGAVTIVSTATRSIEGSIEAGAALTDLAVTPDGEYLFTATRSAIQKFSTVGRNLVREWLLGESSAGIALSPDGEAAYATSGNVLRAYLSTGATTLAAVGGSPTSLATTPDGKRVLTTSGDDNTVSVVSVDERQVLATVPVGIFPTDVAVTPDGDLALVTNGVGTVSAIDLSDNTVLDTIRVGRTPMAVTTSADSQWGYIANANDDSVSVISRQTRSVVRTISTGDRPVALALSPDDSTLYVVNNTSQSVSVLTVERAPTFTASTPSETATVGTPYSYAFAASGFPAPTFEVSEGSLPDGLMLSSDGVLSGTPTKSGLSSFRVTASNGVEPNVTTDSITIGVNAGLVAPSFTASNPDEIATVGTKYAFKFAASGHPAPLFTVSQGSLPDGLELDEFDGSLRGYPTTVGTSTFTVTAYNGVDPRATTGPITITTQPAPGAPVFTASTPPPAATAGTPYSYRFAASGYPEPHFSITQGALPDGLMLSSDGWVSGTPTTAGTSTFAITASNGTEPDANTDPITVTVSAAPQVANTPEQQIRSDATPSAAGTLATTGSIASLAAPLLGAGLLAAGVVATILYRRRRPQ